MTIALARQIHALRAGQQYDHAALQPLACAALVSLVDASCHACGRRLALGIDRNFSVLLSPDGAARFHAIEAAACAVAIGIVVFHKLKRVVLLRPGPRDIEPHCWAQIVDAG